MNHSPSRHAVSVAVMTLITFSTANADNYLQPGFTYTLKAEDAARPITNVVQMGSFVIVQVGSHQLIAINSDSSSERWRFSSKAGAIRNIRVRSGFLLVEAEQLTALEPLSGQEKWQVPLNCYSEKACNTRVRVVHPKVILLSGFDAKDDHIMLIDPKDGTRMWPDWVRVPDAKFLRFTPSTIVVAGAADPYPIIGLDRYTGRERWRFRPEGTEQAARGLLAHGDVVTAWWSNRSADTVYSVSLKSGEELADWMVARRNRAAAGAQPRGGGPGFFYAYQPSLLGGGGALRAWGNKTADKLWRKSVLLSEAPIVRGGRLFTWLKRGAKTALVCWDGKTGKELWAYERAGVTERSVSFHGPLALIRMVGKVSLAAVANIITGKVHSIGPLPKKLAGAKLTTSGKWVFAIDGKRLVRLEPQKGSGLVFQFNEFVAGAQLDEAKKLYQRLRPFVNELPSAAAIHKRISGRGYKEASSRLKEGSLAALLPALQRLMADKNMTFFDDFAGFIVTALNMLEPHDLSGKVKGPELQRLEVVCRRLVELVNRFETKFSKVAKPKTLKALHDLTVTLGPALLRSGAVAGAHYMMWEMYRRPWFDRSDELTGHLAESVKLVLKSKLHILATAVGKQADMDTALLTILEIKGLSHAVPNPPSEMSIPDMVLKDYAAALERFRAAVK